MKPSILIALPHYRPGWKAGGPTRTIANLVEHLGDEFSFRILTSDRDYGDERAFPCIEADRWRRVGKAEVLYMSPARRGVRAFAHALDGADYDALYLNSFFHPQFTVAPLLAYRLCLAKRRPCVIAPRGEFASAALRLSSGKRRRISGRRARLDFTPDCDGRRRAHSRPRISSAAFPASPKTSRSWRTCLRQLRRMPHPHPSRLATGSLFALCCCRACRG